MFENSVEDRTQLPPGYCVANRGYGFTLYKDTWNAMGRCDPNSRIGGFSSYKSLLSRAWEDYKMTEMEDLQKQTTDAFDQLIEAYEIELKDLCIDLNNTVPPDIAERVEFRIVIKDNGEGFKINGYPIFYIKE